MRLLYLVPKGGGSKFLYDLSYFYRESAFLAAFIVSDLKNEHRVAQKCSFVTNCEITHGLKSLFDFRVRQNFHTELKKSVSEMDLNVLILVRLLPWDTRISPSLLTLLLE